MNPAGIWVVYTLMFGYPVPALDAPRFDTESACQVYLGTIHSDVREVFSMVCAREAITTE